MLPYQIGICVRYNKEIFTLAGVLFKGNSDIVLWSPTGGYGSLKDGTKWDPHVTYHADGTYHLASYTKAVRVPRAHRYHYERTRQPIVPSFSGYENLIIQGFAPGYAKAYGRLCRGFDSCVVVDSMDLEYKEDVISDHLGEIRTPLPTASFRVDLIEPNRRDLVSEATFDSLNTKSMLAQELIELTFPWCLVTIFS